MQTLSNSIQVELTFEIRKYTFHVELKGKTEKKFCFGFIDMKMLLSNYSFGKMQRKQIVKSRVNFFPGNLF